MLEFLGFHVFVCFLVQKSKKYTLHTNRNAAIAPSKKCVDGEEEQVDGEQDEGEEEEEEQHHQQLHASPLMLPREFIHTF